MRNYQQTDPHAVFFNPKTDGKPLVESKHTVVTWDGGELFKAFYAEDYRFFDQFTLTNMTPEQAKEIAEEYAAEFDLACDEETDDD